jgi:hypothetical protein
MLRENSAPDSSAALATTMYVAHPQFETPPEEAGLWRYMDWARFIAFIQTRKLYFARIRELDDPWETALPEGLKHRAVKTLGASEQIYDYYQLAAGQAVVSCWHESTYESVAMWRLYTTGAEGVAINTTVGRLKQALGTDTPEVIIGRVQYIDHAADDDGLAPTFNVLGPLFCKRQSFQHEREVRAVIPNPDEAELRKAVAQIQPEPGQIVTVPVRLGNGGLSVSVDVELMLQRIVVRHDFLNGRLWACRRSSATPICR